MLAGTRVNRLEDHLGDRSGLNLVAALSGP